MSQVLHTFAFQASASSETPLFTMPLRWLLSRVDTAFVDAHSRTSGGLAKTRAVVLDDTAALHEHLHAHHMHMQAQGQRRVAPFVIWLLIFLHVAFVGGLLWTWYSQKLGKAVIGAAKRESLPQKVNCVYEFAMPNLRTAPDIKAKS